MNGIESNVIIEIGTILITLLGAILTSIVIPFIRSKTNVEQQKSIEFWTRFSVNAAEQIFDRKGSGQEKKQYVLEFLNSKGINITMEELNILVEAIVKEMNLDKIAKQKIE